MIANQNSYISSAFQQLEIISQDKQKKLEYEAREKAIRDHNQRILEAEKRGELRGEKRGRKEGKEEERLANIFTTISILLELDTELPVITEKLETKYQLPAEKAKEYIRQVMKNSTEQKL